MTDPTPGVYEKAIGEFNADERLPPAFRNPPPQCGIDEAIARMVMAAKNYGTTVAEWCWDHGYSSPPDLNPFPRISLFRWRYGRRKR